MPQFNNPPFIRMSGGATNSVAASSIGGAISANGFASSTATPASPIAGITINSVVGLPAGTYVLTLIVSATSSSKYVFVRSPGGTPSLTMELTSNANATQRLYTAAGTFGYFEFTLAWASLTNTVGTYTANFTVSNVTQNVFPDPTLTEIQNGSYVYRGLYLKAGAAVTGITAYIIRDLGNLDTLEIALPAQGINGVLPTLANVYDTTNVLAGRVWVSPKTTATGLVIPNLAANDHHGLWLRRKTSNAVSSDSPTGSAVVGFGYSL